MVAERIAMNARIGPPERVLRRSIFPGGLVLAVSMAACVLALGGTAVSSAHSAETGRLHEARAAVSLVGDPLEYTFTGVSGEAAMGEWTIHNARSYSVPFDGSLRADSAATVSPVLAKALAVSYRVDGDGGDPIWVDAGTFAEPMSLEEACSDAEHAVCPDVIPAGGNQVIHVRVQLPQARDVAGIDGLDLAATFYLMTS